MSSLLARIQAARARTVADGHVEAREWCEQLAPLAAETAPVAGPEEEEFLALWAGRDSLDPEVRQALHDYLGSRGYPIDVPGVREGGSLFETVARGNVSAPDLRFSELVARAGAQSRRATVCVCDVGFDVRHPVFADNLHPAGGRDYVDFDCEVENPDGDWHGTHVSAIAVAGTDRIALVPVRARQGDKTDTRAVVAAIEYAIEQGARVVNMSFPTTGAHDVGLMRELFARHPEVLFVAAAGNSPESIDGLPPDASMQSNGNLFENLVDVAAAGADGAPWSQTTYGPEKVLLAARGESVLSAIPGGGYGTISGTSMAAPAVVNAAAKCLVLDPGLSPAQLKRLLAATSDQRPEWNGKVGAAGAINPERAMTLAALTGLVRSGATAASAAEQLRADPAEFSRLQGLVAQFV